MFPSSSGRRDRDEGLRPWRQSFSACKFAQLLHQRVGNRDAVRARIRGEFVATVSRQAHAVVRQHRREQRLDALRNKRCCRPARRDRSRAARGRSKPACPARRTNRSRSRSARRSARSTATPRSARAARLSRRRSPPCCRSTRPWHRWSACRRASSAQPSGIGLPSFAATMILPRATSVSDKSIIRGAAFLCAGKPRQSDWCRTAASCRPTH